MKTIVSFLLFAVLALSTAGLTSCKTVPTVTQERNLTAAAGVASYAWARSQPDRAHAAALLTSAADLLDATAAGQPADAIQSVILSVLPDNPDALALGNLLAGYYQGHVDLGNSAPAVQAIAAGLRAGAAPFLTTTTGSK